MATISGYDSSSLSVLFSSLNKHAGSSNVSLLGGGSDLLGINYSDYATIRNGSYLKLMKSYYSLDASDEVKKGKPAPDVFLKVAEKLGTEPKECLVFEDIPNGILAAKRAGMEVCAVEDAYSMDLAANKKKLADYYIKDYNEVLNQTYEDVRNE